MNNIVGLVDIDKNKIEIISIDEKNLKLKRPFIYTERNQNITIGFDGEIYNSKSILKKLEKLGCKLKDESIEEMIFFAYLEFKEDFLKIFEGNFIIIIWDSNKNTLLMARDRLGVKPMFYHSKNKTIIFSSDIKLITEHPEVGAKIDKQSIAEIILVCPGRTPGYAIFKDINQLKPGEVILFSKYGLKKSFYWFLEAKTHEDSFEETTQHVKFLLEESIASQLKFSKNNATFLSGGLDSAIITAVSGIKNTFSVNYEDNDKYFKANKFQPEDDKKYIEIMKNYLGINHTEIVINTEELANALFDAVDARGLPGMADVDSSMLFLCKEVKKYADTAYSGECADEIFGGYPWYRDEKIRMLEGFPWSQNTMYRASFIKGEFLEIDAKEFINEKYKDTIGNTMKLENETNLESRMREMFKLNIDWFMQTLLERAQKMGNFNKLDIKVPFCNYKIAEYLYNVPWEFKDRLGREKGLLRTAFQDVLPEEVTWRKKSPYPKTHNPKYLKKVSKMLEDIITEPTAPILQFIKKDRLIELLKEENNIPWYGQLMTTPQVIAYFVQLNYWLKKYKIKVF